MTPNRPKVSGGPFTKESNEPTHTSLIIASDLPVVKTRYTSNHSHGGGDRPQLQPSLLVLCPGFVPIPNVYFKLSTKGLVNEGYPTVFPPGSQVAATRTAPSSHWSHSTRRRRRVSDSYRSSSVQQVEYEGKQDCRDYALLWRASRQ